MRAFPLRALSSGAAVLAVSVMMAGCNFGSPAPSEAEMPLTARNAAWSLRSESVASADGAWTESPLSVYVDPSGTAGWDIAMEAEKADGVWKTDASVNGLEAFSGKRAYSGIGESMTLQGVLFGCFSDGTARDISFSVPSISAGGSDEAVLLGEPITRSDETEAMEAENENGPQNAPSDEDVKLHHPGASDALTGQEIASEDESENGVVWKPVNGRDPESFSLRNGVLSMTTRAISAIDDADDAIGRWQTVYMPVSEGDSARGSITSDWAMYTRFDFDPTVLNDDPFGAAVWLVFGDAEGNTKAVGIALSTGEEPTRY